MVPDSKAVTAISIGNIPMRFCLRAVQPTNDGLHGHTNALISQPGEISYMAIVTKLKTGGWFFREAINNP